MPIIRTQIKSTTLELVEGDITHQEVDAIVNAANNTLLGGGGVDGAIHRAAGPGLLAETSRMNGCKTGDAKISGGHKLKAKHVIHTVGPVYYPNNPDIPRLLASAYRRSLEVALENGLTSIAFPSISTGAYGYPIEEAATIALSTVSGFVKEHEQISLVRFVLFGNSAFQHYVNALNKLTQSQDD